MCQGLLHLIDIPESGEAHYDVLFPGTRPDKVTDEFEDIMFDIEDAGDADLYHCIFSQLPQCLLDGRLVEEMIPMAVNIPSITLEGK